MIWKVLYVSKMTDSTNSIYVEIDKLSEDTAVEAMKWVEKNIYNCHCAFAAYKVWDV